MHDVHRETGLLLRQIGNGQVFHPCVRPLSDPKQLCVKTVQGAKVVGACCLRYRSDNNIQSRKLSLSCIFIEFQVLSEAKTQQFIILTDMTLICVLVALWSILVLLKIVMV